MADTKNSRIIKYLNMGFDDFVKDLKDFSKIYFPKTSKDLSDASSAQMMIEQAAFVGDVLSFYIEDRLRNSNLQTAKDINSIFVLASSMGYPLQGPRAARGYTNFYIEVPATTGSFGDAIPDMRYAFNVKNAQLQNNNGIIFEALEDVDFSKVNISSSLESKVSKRLNNGSPSHFVLKRQAEVIGGRTVTQTSTISDYQPFRKLELTEPNVLEILSVTDSEGEKWFEVDYHAQEAVYESVSNSSSDSDVVPYILKLKTVPRRFVKKVNPSTGKTSIVFGPGKASEIGTSFVPDPADVALDIKGKLTFSAPFIDPQNFLKTRTLGLAPYSTTLTIKYRVGGGKITNTSVSSLKDVIGKEIELNSSGLSTVELNNTLASFSTENTERIEGGDEAETPEEIRQNASAFFAAQGRLNTKEDFMARSLSLPSSFGKIFRVYASNKYDESSGVQLYVIAKNNQDQLTKPSDSLKKNLKTYLSKFTRINQGVDILDGKIANIGIEFSIVTLPGYNKTKVKTEALKKVKDFFEIKNWNINQPVIIDEVRVLIKETEGVLSISEFKIINKNNTIDGNQYSDVVFSVENNTKNNILFPPENCIFEVKYRNGPDIKVAAL